MQVGDLVQSKDYFFLCGDKKFGIIIKGPYPWGTFVRRGSNIHYTVLWNNGEKSMIRAKEVNIISESRAISKD